MRLLECRKVLLMVAELHTRGYQRLRISPGMAPSGSYWRCVVTPASNVSADHGALLVDWNGLAAHYTSGHESHYFDLGDGAQLTPSQLADRFTERYPYLVEAGSGRDGLYAEWYQEMLSLTYPELLPVAYADWGWDLPEDGLGTIGDGDGVVIPMPPAGESARNEGGA